MVRIRTVHCRERFEVELGFTDGTSKVVDLGPWLHGPVFEPLRLDESLFRSVSVDPVLGTVVWPNGADLDPDVLRWDLPPAAPMPGDASAP